ncbi:MAG: excinuclease ABC subunit UvrC [Deltaproteobacteria bacterium]|nr:excinuclease ABC subunit UvrC [Deltaproteobacteria bacterium]
MVVLDDTTRVHIDSLNVAEVPESPGVYLFRDSEGKVLYVGKAKNLRKRLGSYWRENVGIKVSALLKRALSVEFVVTRDEHNAFVLEAQLIKHFRPRYNVVLRDDKNYPALRIDLREEFPRLEIVRRLKNDGALYFGPYTSGFRLKEAVKLLRRAFPIRTCSGKVLVRRKRPCLNYDLGLCPAPCSGRISREVYLESVNKLVNFLNGGVDSVKAELVKEMKKAADELEFERAAELRDRIKAIDAVISKQTVVTPHYTNQDYIGLCESEGVRCIAVLFVRNGAVTGHRVYDVSNAGGRSEEILASFVRQMYGSTRLIPDEIVVSGDIEDREMIQDWLRNERNKRVFIICRPRGFRKELLAMAVENARAHVTSAVRRKATGNTILNDLSDLVGLSDVPHYIACVDTSNFHGKFSVGVVVVFKNGVPDPSKYQAYPIDDNVAAQGDPEMVAFTIRKFRLEERKIFDLIDLWIIDGGKGQLRAALREVKNSSSAVISIAKEREEDSRFLRLQKEKVYVPGRKDPLDLADRLHLLRFIQKVRDEAHRFAISRYREKRRQTLRQSLLDAIPGIGPKRKAILLKYFKDISSIKEADLEDLMAVPGIPPSVARRVYEFFHFLGR